MSPVLALFITWSMIAGSRDRLFVPVGTCILQVRFATGMHPVYASWHVRRGTRVKALACAIHEICKCLHMIMYATHSFTHKLPHDLRTHAKSPGSMRAINVIAFQNQVGSRRRSWISFPIRQWKAIVLRQDWLKLTKLNILRPHLCHKKTALSEFESIRLPK